MLIKFKDTVKADVADLKVARENLHKGIILLLFAWIMILCLALCFYFIQHKVTALMFLGCSILYLIIVVALIIKREIYSVMIYLKQKEKHEWR